MSTDNTDQRLTPEEADVVREAIAEIEREEARKIEAENQHGQPDQQRPID